MATNTLTPPPTGTVPVDYAVPDTALEFDPKVSIGRSGLKQYGGFVFEDINTKLRGQKAAEAFKEILQNSALVGGILRLIDLSLRGVEKFVEPFSDDAEDVKRAERLEQALDDMSHSWEDTMSETATMIPYGYAPMEIIWKTCHGWSEDPTMRSRYDDGLIMPRKIELRSQDSLFRWVFDAEGGLKAMIQLPPPDYIMRTIPIEKMLLFRPRVEKGNPEGSSVLRQGYWNWIMIKRLTEYEAIRAEKDATGILVAEIPAENMVAGSANSSVFDYAKKLVTGYRVSDQGGIVWPRAFDPKSNQEKFKLSLLSAQGGGAIFDYDKVITRHEVRLAISMLADVILLGHTNVGSWALSKDKTANVLKGAINTWLDSIYSVWNRHMLPRIWQMNGWPMDRMAKMKHGESKTKDLEALAHAVQLLAQAGMALFPDEALENLIREEAGWPDKPQELIDQEHQEQEATQARNAALQQAMATPGNAAAAGPGKVPPQFASVKKSKYQPRSRRGVWAPPGATSADVSAALGVLRDRQSIGGNDEIAHGFKVASPPPFDPKTMSYAHDLDSAPVQSVALKDMVATQPSVKRETVRAFLENPNTVAVGQRDMLGRPVDLPVVTQHEGKAFIVDGHNRLAAKKLMGYSDALVRVVGLPANQGEQQVTKGDA